MCVCIYIHASICLKKGREVKKKKVYCYLISTQKDYFFYKMQLKFKKKTGGKKSISRTLLITLLLRVGIVQRLVNDYETVLSYFFFGGGLMRPTSIFSSPLDDDGTFKKKKSLRRRGVMLAPFKAL